MPFIAVLALGATAAAATLLPGHTEANRGAPAMETRGTAPPQAAMSTHTQRESRHRDGEGGAVILELGDGGLRPLRCHGHRFLAVMDRPHDAISRGAPTRTLRTPDEGVIRKARRGIEVVPDR